MTATKAALLLLAFLSASPPVRLSAQDYRAQALRILKTVPLIDGHNDLADAIRARGGLDSVDVAALQPKLMSDIPKLRAGGVGAPFRGDVVHEMKRLAILVDLSHVNDATMSDALHATRAPVMFSHSSARALTGHARDVPDSILKLVPKNGGIVMVNFNPGFVSEAVRLYEDSMEARARALRAAGVEATSVAESTKVWAARAP